MLALSLIVYIPKRPKPNTHVKCKAISAAAAATKKKEIYMCVYEVSLVQLSPSRSVSSLSLVQLSPSRSKTKLLVFLERNSYHVCVSGQRILAIYSDDGRKLHG
jgi:hypothetical protein